MFRSYPSFFFKENQFRCSLSSNLLVFLDPGRRSGLKEKPKKWHKDIKVMEGRRHGLGKRESPNIFWCSEEKDMTLDGVEMASTQHSSD